MHNGLVHRKVRCGPATWSEKSGVQDTAQGRALGLLQALCFGLKIQGERRPDSIFHELPTQQRGDKHRHQHKACSKYSRTEAK